MLNRKLSRKYKVAPIQLKFGLCGLKALITKFWKFENPTKTPSGRKPEVKENLKIALNLFKIGIHVAETLIIQS